MVTKTDYALFTPPDDGSVDWRPIIAAFEQIHDKINENADELKAAVRHNTQTISIAIEGPGVSPLLRAGKHFRGKIVNAFAVMGDSILSGTTVEIQGITNVLKFSDSEKAGKVRIFQIIRSQLHFIDELRISQTGDRRMIISVTIESSEEES